METALKKDLYECMSLVWSGTAGRETAEEYVVPDALPDVGAVLDAEGVLTMRGKETQDGYIQLSASLAVSVMYTPDDGVGVRCLELTLPADVRLDAPGVDADCRSVARLRLRGIDARVLNSRKISVRAELEAQAQCYRRENLELASGLAEDAGTAHVLTKNMGAMVISDVREKTFAVTDEYQLPAGCTGSETVLSRRMEMVVDSVKYVSGKAVFHGRVRTEMLFGEIGSVQMYAGQYETEFSQIMEVDAQGEEAMPSVSLFLTGAYFDMPEYGREDGRVSVEIHMAAQCVCRERRELTYIADIYSNRTELVPELESVPAVTEIRAVSMRQTVAGRAEPFPADGQLIRASASVSGVTIEEDAVKTSVNVRLLYGRPDGTLASTRCRLSAEFTSPEVNGDTRLDEPSVTVTDISCTVSGGVADVRAALQMDGIAVTESAVSCVSAVREDAEAFSARENTPSFTLIRVPEGTDMWSVARRYRSTVEAIGAANEGRQEGLLLIPKGR